MERKIYDSWAFTKNEREKAKINFEIYKSELKPKAKQFYNNEMPTEEDMKKFTCYKCIKNGYAHNVYKIFNNPHNFSTLQLALICDGGNLCYGYSTEWGNIVIHTD